MVSANTTYWLSDIDSSGRPYSKTGPNEGDYILALDYDSDGRGGAGRPTSVPLLRRAHADASGKLYVRIGWQKYYIAPEEQTGGYSGRCRLILAPVGKEKDDGEKE